MIKSRFDKLQYMYNDRKSSGLTKLAFLSLYYVICSLSDLVHNIRLSNHIIQKSVIDILPSTTTESPFPPSHLFSSIFTLGSIFSPMMAALSSDVEP